ncbi:5,6-dimethylbenzimidazole synthase [Paucibacter sp. Y2R2-4]|uniref:5,6-dimethylbenzimidazole synthase n=1 Tax=Paucibacter sp. Y2R2-4 TaxID=2893553 RepID=UPI0021E37463|nr:5,6-dimethylbenzimidazole synthase [Paucibacter sp. Y2R2-4]MCV2349904.1 5,6-dimethylbenzimidazole synthase [Paucibacter sp. Y2R2-4]
MQHRPQHQFSPEERASVYELMALRRDTRHFKAGSRVEPEQVQRLLQAAHQAPSVGLSQPWRLLRISSPELRQALALAVERERQATAEALNERREEFLRLKVEGMQDCAELWVIVLAPDDGTLFGRRTLPREMVLASVGCVVQNLWLAARAENLGLGWVSMFDPAEVAALLHLPAGALALGLLCLGPVDSFYPAPMLEMEGWRHARPLDEMFYTDRWPAHEESAPADLS